MPNSAGPEPNKDFQCPKRTGFQQRAWGGTDDGTTSDGGDSQHAGAEPHRVTTGTRPANPTELRVVESQLFTPTASKREIENTIT